jgi:hypothetical protein
MGPGDAITESYVEVSLVFTLNNVDSNGLTSARDLIKSPPLLLLRQLRLSSLPSERIVLPVGLDAGGRVSFGASGLLHVVTGHSFCRLSDTLRSNKAQLASLEITDGQISCTFVSDQL